MKTAVVLTLLLLYSFDQAELLLQKDKHRELDQTNHWLGEVEGERAVAEILEPAVSQLYSYLMQEGSDKEFSIVSNFFAGIFQNRHLTKLFQPTLHPYFQSYVTKEVGKIAACYGYLPLAEVPAKKEELDEIHLYGEIVKMISTTDKSEKIKKMRQLLPYFKALITKNIVGNEEVGRIVPQQPFMWEENSKQFTPKILAHHQKRSPALTQHKQNAVARAKRSMLTKVGVTVCVLLIVALLGARCICYIRSRSTGLADQPVVAVPGPIDAGPPSVVVQMPGAIGMAVEAQPLAREPPTRLRLGLHPPAFTEHTSD